MKNSSQLLRFTETCIRLATPQVPLYSGKFSKRTFTQPQLLTLYCLKLKADKGYDDQAHRSKLRSWGKRPLIKHRELKPYDKAANARMDQELYHRRSLVETVISVLKRKYGDAVSSRRWWRQFRELVAMCLVYNLERAVKLGVTLLDRLWARLLYFLQRRISTEPSPLTV